MSVKKYKFISPGVFINEIDNSALPASPANIGPLVIGATRRGPAMRPVRVDSFSEFIEKFGTPNAGIPPQDVWRNGAGILTSPTYASYAAQAWLQNNSPITVVRLLGEEHSEAATAGYAGWATEKQFATAQGIAHQGGAYGLFICASSSTDATIGADLTPSTGALAAIVYCNSGSALRLSGTVRASGSAAVVCSETTASAGVMMYSQGSNHTFTLEVISGTDPSVDVEKFAVNFDRNSQEYIREVMSTNPAATNASVTTAAKAYWLGETYDQFLEDTVGTGGDGHVEAAGGSLGIVLQLSNGSLAFGNNKYAHRPAQSGWVISQDMGAYSAFNARAQTKLFKLHSRGAGSYEMHNLKASIENIRAPKNNANPWSTFTLSLRMLSDNDGKIREVERYTNLTLNPNSANYIASRIGDKYIEFDSVEGRNKEYGQYDNASEFVRIEMHADIEDSGPPSPAMAPFGFYGPPRFKGFSLVGTGSGPSIGEFQVFGDSHTPDGATGAGTAYTNAGTTDLPLRSLADAVYHLTGAVTTTSGTHDLTASFLFPTIAMRLSSSDNPLPSNATAFHGMRTHRSASSLYDESMVDLLRGLPDRLLNSDGAEMVFSDEGSLGANLEIPHIFTLDDVISGSNALGVSDTVSHAYVSGSRIAGLSISADQDGHTKGALTRTGWEATILYGADAFTFPLFGGSDGLNIREKDPFGHHVVNGQTEKSSYAYNTVKQAIDICSDPEDVEYNLAVAPNIRSATLTQHLIDTVEARADAMAIIDVESDYTPAAEDVTSYKARLGDVNNAVKLMKDRNIDSSFAAAYYPYVQIVDKLSNNKLFMPPSVIALGVMSNSERKSSVWFAPAGFNRGGLSQGAAGLPVVNVTQKLSKKDRDDLYDANINPIASFPSEGLVVFGQKTLQATPSALDRVNVRRLLIFLKKKISRIANSVLFDQNSKVTWNRFTGQVEPFLKSVKAGMGLEDYRVVLDDTTTTPDLVDRNVLYAKIFLKPAKSIEYIAIDFNITNQGAAFDD